MNDFGLWFFTGVEHIASLDGYDHILFLAILVVAFQLHEWKKLLVLITAFTLGHSLSLALSVYKLVEWPQQLTEALIALTLLLGAVFQLLPHEKTPMRGSLLYGTVAVFGLIHGMGFSYLLSSMLGESQAAALPLLYFNLGLELGQILVLSAIVLFSLLLTSLLRVPYKIYKLTSACIIAIIALTLCVGRLREYFLQQV